MQKKYLLFALMLLPLSSRGQYPYFTNFTVNHGLASNRVYNIIEDRYGFIWISTDHGVSRYDGVAFTNFTAKNGLPDNEVLGLYEDSAGRIWFNGFSTEPCYYYHGKIYNSENDSLLKRIKQNKLPGMCMSFIIQHNNSMGFLITEHNSKWIVGKEIPDIPIKYEGTLPGNLLQNILIRNGARWYAISHQYKNYWNDEDSLHPLQLNVPFPINMHYTQHPGKTLYGFKPNTHQVWVFNPVDNTTQQIKVEGQYTNLFNTHNLHILSGDSNYILYNSNFSRVIETATLPFAFERVYIDRKGNKWFGSFDRGIYFIRKAAPVKIILPEDKTHGILGIVPYKDKLLLKTEKNGLLQVTENGKCASLFYANDIRRVTGYAPSGTGQLVGTDAGLFRLSGNFTQAKLIYKSAVKDMEAGTNNEVLVGTGTSSLICFVGKEDSLVFIDYERTTAICRVDDTTIWLGNLNGIRQCKQRGDLFIIRELSLHKELDESRIVDIKKDKQGNVWIATDQKGLFFCPPNGEIIRLSESSSKNRRILSDMCLQIVADDAGCVWLATVGGLSVITPFPALSVSNYSLPEGMPDKNISSIAFLHKQVFVSTPNGLFRFTSLSHPSEQTGETMITRIEVNGKEIEQVNPVLTYDQNNLLISYAASFINAGLFYRFRYRIKELAPGWIETNTLQVPLLGLKPGDYTFEIKSVNTHGNSGKAAQIKFSILTPWFFQWWFLLSVTGILLFSVFYYYKLAREKIIMGRDLTLLKLRILRAQINPHFVFNALSNIQRLIQIGSLKQAEGYIGTLSYIMRKSIDYSAEEFIELYKEIDYSKNYLDIEKMRFGEKFEVSFQILIAPDELFSLYVPPLILQPILENTIKHAFKGIDYKGEVKVRIEKPNPQLIRYVITDNGRGFDTTGTSTKKYGLGITSERIDLLYKNMKTKGTMHLISSIQGANTGTVVTIDLPVLKD